MRKLTHGLISLLLVLSVMVGMLVPFSITASAEDETAAIGSDIHAFLYYIDPNKKVNGEVSIDKNLELIFQRGGDPDPTELVFKHLEYL